MGKKRNQYTKEYKIEVVRLMSEESKPIGELEREIGVAQSLLHRWKKKYEEGKIDPFSGKGRLSRENNRLRMERDILKKSSGHFLEGTAMKYVPEDFEKKTVA